MARDPQVGRRRFGTLRERIDADSNLRLLDSSQEAQLLEFPHERGKYSREHFGFADGFSQPAIRGNPRPKNREGMGTPLRRGKWSLLAPGEFVLGYPGEDGLLPEAPPAPLGRSGTFMVVRKLEQHVARFRKYLRRRAEQDLPYLRGLPGSEGSNPSEEALALRQQVLAAKIVGRWQDGRSLVLYPEPNEPDKKKLHPINRFLYSQDPDGFGCPLGAHVRRANPRDDFGWQGRLTKRHRIIRRGMPYGRLAFDEPGALFDPNVEDLDPDHDKGRGLMFICYQASIARQFEVIQQRWLNDGDPFWLGGDRDFLTISGNRPDPDAPLEGGNGWSEGEEASGGKMTIQGTPPSFLAPQPSFVTLKGGEYFFTPGLAALRALASAYWH
jgi:Dyp-type peroxidase family